MMIQICHKKANEAAQIKYICVSSQHSVFQSMSKNALSFTSSEHENRSMIIEILGTYSTYPHEIVKSNLMIKTKSFDHY